VYSLEAHERIQPYVTLHRASIQPAHPQAESERERWGGGGGGRRERDSSHTHTPQADKAPCSDSRRGREGGGAVNCTPDRTVVSSQSMLNVFDITFGSGH
jgi:hypothetical protein